MRSRQCPVNIPHFARALSERTTNLGVRDGKHSLRRPTVDCVRPRTTCRGLSVACKLTLGGDVIQPLTFVAAPPPAGQANGYVRRPATASVDTT